MNHEAPRDLASGELDLKREIVDGEFNEIGFLDERG